MKKINKNLIIYAGAAAILTASCTKLNEELYGSRTEDTGTTVSSSTLNSVYDQLNAFSDQANIYALDEHATDEMMGPTRGTDWDDFGTWRKLHQHTWDPSHNQIYDTWNILNTGVFRATQVVSRATDNATKAEASFLRAFFMYKIVDDYGQQPFREVTDSPDANPKVFSRKEATDFMIKDLEFAVANLTNGNTGKANKDAAEFLLAKIYLNKAVFYQDPASPAGPYTFAAADMNKALTYLNDIVNSGRYRIASNYYDNFKWDNTTASTEIIFARVNDFGTGQLASAENRTRMVEHYNTTPDGWNGFTTLADFYNSFENNDIRKNYTLPGYTNITGQNVGFLAGQQKKYVNGALVNVKDRSGNDLSFTANVNLGYATEAEGIRAVKFPLNPANFGQSGNDYVFFRYADVVLMKAEAILRGGTDAATPLALLNQIRTARNASALTAAPSLDVMLAERGREMYWEGWRRNDLIRFGKFNAPVDQRASTSAGYRVVYPIPQRAVDSNPNLKQNTGY